MTRQPREAQHGDPVDTYREVLTAEGLTTTEIENELHIISVEGQRLEVERWNRILTCSKPAFNTKPNEFLVKMVRGISPGQALDVGMGEGRNAIYLAQQGWSVTGFDPADRAMAVAEKEAKRLGVELITQVRRDEDFEFGNEQWDLVVLSYVSLRGLVPQIYDALKPGGSVVVEGFHRDATRFASIGGGVVFDTNELLKLFERFRVIRYEDAERTSDFGLRKTCLVRLCAQRC